MLSGTVMPFADCSQGNIELYLARVGAAGTMFTWTNMGPFD